MDSQPSSSQLSVPPAPSSGRQKKLALMISLVAVVLIIVALVGVWFLLIRPQLDKQQAANSSQSNTNPNLAEEYYSFDPKLPFSIQPPKGWKLQTNPPEGTAVGFNILKQGADGKPKERAYISVDYTTLKEGEQTTLAIEADAEKNYIVEHNQDLQLITNKDVDLGGTAGRQVEWTDTFRGEQTHNIELIVLKAPVVYYVLFSTSVAEWDNFKEVAPLSVLSFRPVVNVDK